MDALTVLHIDDEPGLLDAVALCLGRDPALTVVSAGSGPEALDLLQEGLSPDVVVLDVAMPGMDGLETLSRLREIQGFERTPVAFMTAGDRPHEQARYLSLGAAAVISKPFDPALLTRDLRSLAVG